MSMNLIFRVKGCKGYVDFPFQTPTKLTYSVLNCKSKEKQLKLIKDYIDDMTWDPVIKKTKIKEVKDLLKSPYLKLIII